MKLSRFLTTVILITTVSLFYVHQQIELIKQSYKIQSNQHNLDDLLDQNRILKYNVIALKAPVNLENQLVTNDIKLVLPERWQVVRVSSRIEKEGLTEEKQLPLVFSFLRFFALNREAQAKPTD